MGQDWLVTLSVVDIQSSRLIALIVPHAGGRVRATPLMLKWLPELSSLV